MSESQFKLASDFKPLSGEANFGPPILTEVVGGAHIAPECVTVRNGKFVMVEWPNGLPRHDKGRTVRFPHGLMCFGETTEQCAKRLIADQLGMNVDKVQVLRIDSYVDDMNHWHIEPLLLATVSGEPKLPPEASRIVLFEGDQIPQGAVWGEQTFKEAYANDIRPALRG